jgi:hypothetical protein
LGAGQQHQLHGLLQILGQEAIPPLQRRQGTGGSQGKLFSPVPLDVAADGLLHQVEELFPLRLDLGQPLPRQEDAGADFLQFRLVLGQEGLGSIDKLRCPLDNFPSLF